MAACDFPHPDFGFVNHRTKAFLGIKADNDWEETCCEANADSVGSGTLLSTRTSSSSLSSSTSDSQSGHVELSRPGVNSHLNHRHGILPSACPIAANDWRCNPVPEDFSACHSVANVSHDCTSAAPDSYQSSESTSKFGGLGAGAGRAADGYPSSCPPSLIPAVTLYASRQAQDQGLKEHLLRASSIPRRATYEAPAPGAPNTRRKSLSVRPEQSPSELLLQQQYSQQLQAQEHKWRLQHQAPVEEQQEDEKPADAAVVAAVQLDEWSAVPSECLNIQEVEDLCARMDIAGMRVEQVDICCPPPELVADLVPEGVSCVVLAIKFEGMTIQHYPGDHRTKQLFGDMYSVW